MINQTQKKWVDQYEMNPTGYIDLSIQNKVPHFWRDILKKTKLNKGDSVFEIGFGGGKQLIHLALVGMQVSGIECSPIATQNAMNNIAYFQKKYDKQLGINLFEGDFERFVPQKCYQMCYSVGVAEHYLDAKERIAFYKKQHEILVSGGKIVVYVPSGTHSRRALMREKKLGGYNIPEIDYTVKSMTDDLLESGFRNIKVYPVHLYSYLLDTYTSRSTMSKVCAISMYILFNKCLYRLLSENFKEKHAYTLIGIGEKNG